MPPTLSDQTYVTDALAALGECKTDRDLTAWDDTWCNNEQYIHLPDALIRKLEEAYDDKVRWVCGIGGG